MQILEIPANVDEASFKILTTLEGVPLIMRFDWSDRQERWSLSIYDQVETPILLGLSLEVDGELIYRFEIPGLPPGRLLFYDTSGKGKAAGRDDLGKRCLLLYRTSV